MVLPVPLGFSEVKDGIRDVAALAALLTNSPYAEPRTGVRVRRGNRGRCGISSENRGRCMVIQVTELAPYRHQPGQYQ